MNTYQEKKNKLGQKSEEFMSGMRASEVLVEERIREILGPFGDMIQKMEQIIDTKKPAKRDELLKFLIENPGTLKTLKENFEELINVTRL